MPFMTLSPPRSSRFISRTRVPFFKLAKCLPRSLIKAKSQAAKIQLVRNCAFELPQNAAIIKI
jgi:hypothetical protein